MELLLVLAAWALMGLVGRWLQSPRRTDETTPPLADREEDVPQWLADLTARLEEWADATDEPADTGASVAPAPPTAAPLPMAPVRVTAPAAPAREPAATTAAATPAPSPAPVAVRPPMSRPARRPLTQAEWRHALVMATIFNPPRAEDPYRWPE